MDCDPILFIFGYKEFKSVIYTDYQSIFDDMVYLLEMVSTLGEIYLTIIKSVYITTTTYFNL